MTPRWNIALLPIDPDIQFRFAHLSQKHFGAIHDNYILGPDGLAHVTLCQFRAEDERAAQSVYQSFIKLAAAPAVAITGFQIRPGKQDNAGKSIAEYIVRKDPPLMALQARCFTHLTQSGFLALTPMDDYFPHFTLACLSGPCLSTPTMSDLHAPEGMEMRLGLGLSSESGVFVREIQGGSGNFLP